VQTPDEIRRDLVDDLTAVEADALAAIAMRLQALRPVPAPAFRGRLRRSLLGSRRSGRREVGAPRSVRALATAYVAAGTFLVGLAGVGLAGAGPFAS
jgi:hypothetical protein